MRVLIVDDDVKVRAALRVLLETAGFEVVEAGDGQEGARAYRRQAADVVLCDLFMPGRDGLELIRDLRREFPGVKIVAMSGGGFKGTVDMLPVARFFGAASVLYKPFDQAAAVAALERILQAPVGV
jgi:CheY-like chemotaxis protein